MPLRPALEAKLSKRFEADARIDDTFSGKDITFITDRNGYPVTLFIGKRRPDGSIAGERYVRRLKMADDNETIKSSHWEAKGNVSRS